MATPSRKSVQLVVAILILVGAIAFGWIADNAYDTQRRILGGCWPDHVQIDGQTKLTSLFWEEQMHVMTLGPVERFFHSRTDHRILLYLSIFAAIAGWSASILLTIVRAQQSDPPSRASVTTWDAFLSSLILAGLAGGVLFLLSISARLGFDPSGDRCIGAGYSYLFMAGAFVAGLSVVAFFDWLANQAQWIWEKLTGRGT